MEPRRLAPRLAPRLALTALLLAGFVLARIAGRDAAAALAVAGLVLLAAAPALHTWHRRVALLAGIGLAGGLLAAVPGGLTVALQALPLAVNALVALHFGATLRPGREPLIAFYTRLDRGGMPPECETYARRLTWLWAVVSGGLAVAHGLSFVLASLQPGPVLAANAAIVGGVFLGEHVVRSIRFPHFGLASPLRTCQVMLSAGAAPAVRHAG